MILRLWASASSSHAAARSAVPISANVAMTASFAPPWSGPLSAPTAPVTAECRSDSVDVMTRAVNVDALNECSAYSTIETSNARTTAGSGSSPNVIHRKFSA
ncbi:Uncharacterised protein [Mycobacteroides abscessus]|nr:Uncharacterised protein [Mycobacteroides abscessus]